MAINSSHSIGQYCRWAILPVESLSEQSAGVSAGGTIGSTVVLSEGTAYIPGSPSTSWATPVSKIDPYNNSITIVWYGRFNITGTATLASYLQSYGWHLRAQEWSTNVMYLTLGTQGSGSQVSAQIGITSGTVHHLAVRFNKATSKVDVFLDGILKTANLSFSGDSGAVGGGGAFFMQNQSTTSACITCQIYEGALSDSDIASLAASPIQIFAAPPQDLAVSNLSQANSASEGEIGLGGILYGSALLQSNAVSSAQITRVQDLAVSNLTQTNSIPFVSVNPYNRLRTILRDLPVNTWVQVNTSQYIDCQMPLADRPASYPNAVDHVKIVIPWSSIAFDRKRGHLLLWGGGHANYTGNQLYQWHADTGEWSLACLPSKLSSDGNLYVVDKKAPQSSHTYQNNFWLKENDMFGTFGGAATPSGSTFQEDNGGSARRVGPWLYDLTKTDPNKVGGSDGSGMDVARLGLNAWQHRRDNVPTGVAGTDTFPIDYANHVSQSAVSVSKDGKDYVIFTMDANSGFPSWYRYEFGDIHAGEDDQCIYLGRTTQSNTPALEGWMTYDSKRELAYRVAYAKNADYTRAELIAKKPWVAGVAETPIRLVHSADSSQFAMTPVTDECPYGVVYDERNDCLWIWGGTSPDTGVVYRANIPAYDGTAGWSSTTWNVDAITPAGSRPNGLYQSPILGKIKHVPEIESFIILDRAGSAGDPDPGVWLFKTAQIQGDLIGSDLDQGSSVDTVSVTVTHALSAGASIQGNSASEASIAQVGVLSVSNLTQSSLVDTGSLTQVHNLSASNLAQSNTSSSAAISREATVNLAYAPVSQNNSAGEDTVGQVHNITVSGLGQANSSPNAAITQTHALVVVGISQVKILADGTITKNGLLVIVSVTQSNALDVAGVGQEHILAPSEVTQGNTVSTNEITVVSGDLVVSSLTQGNICQDQRIVLTQILIAVNRNQSNALPNVAITVRDGPILKIDPRYIVYGHYKNYTAKYGD